MIGYGIACYFNLVFIFLSFESLNRFSTLVTYSLTLKFEHESLPHTFCHICMCIMMKESSFKFNKPILPFILSSYQNKNFKNNLTSFNIIEAISFLTCYTKKTCYTTQFHLDFPCVEVMIRKLLDPNIKR